VLLNAALRSWRQQPAPSAGPSAAAHGCPSAPFEAASRRGCARVTRWDAAIVGVLERALEVDVATSIACAVSVASVVGVARVISVASIVPLAEIVHQHF